MKHTMRFIWLIPLFVLVGAYGCSNSSNEDAVLSLPETINVAVRVNPASYYWIQDKVVGLDHDLLMAFAKHSNVKINPILVKTMGEALKKLESNEVSIALGVLSSNQALNQRYAVSPPYYHVQHKIIYRYSKTAELVPLSQLSLEQIDVSNHPIHIETLEYLKEKNKDNSNWHLVQDLDSHNFIELVNEGLINYAIIDSNELAVTHIFYPYVKELTTFVNQIPVVWFLQEDGSTELSEAVEKFFAQLKKTRELDKLIDTHYFNHSLTYADKVTFIKHYSNRLPQYKNYFTDVAKESNIDWKLLAATSYQESHWKRKAISPTQVKGLMMVTQEVAERHKVKDRFEPYSNINAGSLHLLEIKNMLSRNILEPDRTWMALAAYNIGIGHLQDAFALTKKLGGNPNYWIDVAKSLDLLQKKQWALKSKYGVPKGGNATVYVNNIRVYYKLLAWLEGDISTAIKTKVLSNTYTPPR